MKNLIFLTLLSISSLPLVAQDSSITRQEIWPEIDLYYRFSEKLRIYAHYSATKLRNSDYTDGGYGLYMDYFASPLLKNKLDTGARESTRSHYLWFRVGYMYSTSPPDSEDPFKSHTIVTEINGSIYLPYQILLTNKNRFDWTVKIDNFLSTYRPRLAFLKNTCIPSIFISLRTFTESTISISTGAALIGSGYLPAFKQSLPTI